MNDLIVVLPGIMGSALAVDGKPVWDVTFGSAFKAALSVGRNLNRLTVTGPIGSDGVTATRLLPTVHALPFWTPLDGYDVVVKTLRQHGFTEEIGNLLPLPYDWRHSVPDIVGSLRDRIEAALEHLRSQGGRFTDARITFVAHSMGGLVARWYAASPGAAPVHRIVTLGTPHRGAMNALDKLHAGVATGWKKLLLNNINTMARSFPGLHHLLPTYACVNTPSGLRRLDVGDVPGLSPSLVRDGLEFTGRLEALEDSGLRDRLYPIIGRRQRTSSTCRIEAGEIEFLSTYPRDGVATELAGDGTVPVMSIPSGWKQSDVAFHPFAEQHGSLQVNRDVLVDVIRSVTDEDIVFAGSDDREIGVRVPDLIVAGESLAVEVTAEQPVQLMVRITPESGPVIQRPLRVPAGTATLLVEALPEGLATVVVGAPPGSPIRVAPVTARVLVWPAEDL